MAYTSFTTIMGDQEGCDEINGRFDPTVGHTHDGTDMNGGKINATSVVNTPAGNITATTVQGAINQIATFKGCRVYNNSGGNQSIAAFNSQKVIFNTVSFDTNNFWDAINTRINIPSGVSMINLYGGVFFPEAYTTANTARGVQLKLNNNIINTVSVASTSNTTGLSITSGPIAVSSGNYIELYASNLDSVAKNISQSLVTFLVLEVLA